MLTTAAIFTFIWTWDDFFAPLIYLNDMKQLHRAARPPHLRRLDRRERLRRPLRHVVLSLVPIFVFFLFFQRLLIEGIATTGMKR